jgi:serine/threonine-protein kinase
LGLEPGSHFGPYTILEPLGRGGMATVFRAHDSALERDIALKVLPAQFVNDPTWGERFQREAKVIAKLEHPHIVPIYAVGIEGGTPWMSMRLVSGGSVSQIVEGGRIDAARAVRLLKGVARALDYAHGKAVIHRDVKPSNILLDEEERAYLADFGIARLMESSTFVTRSGLVTGTPQYMAPEQARSERAGHLCDIYSLGVVAYQLLTGRVPFTGESPVNVLMQHVMDPVPVPDRSIVSEPVADVLLRCLEKEPGQRWPSAGAFVDALDAAQAGVPPATIRAAARNRPGRGKTLPSPRPAVPREPLPPLPPLEPLTESRADDPGQGHADWVRTDAATSVFDPRWQVPLPIAVVTLAAVAGTALFLMIRLPMHDDPAPPVEPPAAAVSGTPTPEPDASPGPAAGSPSSTRRPPVEARRGDTWLNPQDGAVYVYLPPSEGFDRGCVPGDDECYPDESPRRRVALTEGLWLGRTEVTVEAYRRYAEAVGRSLPDPPTFNPEWSDPGQPIVSLTWEEASTFCEWAGGRLPTEAEWERAARGGGIGRLYPWGGAAPVCASGEPNGARFDDDAACAEQEPAAVGSYRPNDFGIFDMTGNVWEWCQDWYAPRYYASAPDADPQGPDSGSERVLRGGSANSVAVGLRLSLRNHLAPRVRSVFVGFRCAVNPAG